MYNWEYEDGEKGIQSLSIEVDGLQDLLKKHSEVEEQIFYPRLMEVLSQEQQNLIVKKINEVEIKE